MKDDLKFEIRPIDIEDAPAMHAMRIMPGVRETTSAISSERAGWSEQYIRSLGDNDFSFVAEVDGGGEKKVIGFVWISVDRRARKRHVGTLAIMVHPKWQRKGVGRRLMKHIMDFADNWLMLKRVELIVFASNEHAVRLYESFGFEIEGRMRSGAVMHGAYVDELVMGRLI